MDKDINLHSYRKEIDAALATSIENAKQANQQAEYILALLDKRNALSEKQSMTIKTQRLCV
jgi:hypothetical protein